MRDNTCSSCGWRIIGGWRAALNGMCWTCNHKATGKREDEMNPEDEYEQLCVSTIEALKGHKDAIIKPVAISRLRMAAMQWKLQQSVRVDVGGTVINCVVGEGPDNIEQAIIDASTPEPPTELDLMRQRAERAEAELRGYEAARSNTDGQELGKQYKRNDYDA